jgi:hypothetical protein
MVFILYYGEKCPKSSSSRYGKKNIPQKLGNDEGAFCPREIITD